MKKKYVVDMDTRGRRGVKCKEKQVEVKVDKRREKLRNEDRLKEERKEDESGRR